MKSQLFSSLTVCAGLLVAIPAFASAVADHRAIYQMTLDHSSAGSGVQGVDGQMALEVRGQCDTITVNQLFKSDFWGADGKPKHSELAISSLEAANGASFRFSLHNEVDGAVAEHFKGEATRAKNAGDGAITYDAEAFPPAALPADAIFPTEHMNQLLAAAQAGKQTLSVLVFDGAEKGKIYRATALIGRKVEGGDVPKGLEGVARWPMSISYFPTASQEAVPEYETSFDLYANGVSAALIIDYGDFAMRARLIGLQLLPKAKCN